MGELGQLHASFLDYGSRARVQGYLEASRGGVGALGSTLLGLSFLDQRSEEWGLSFVGVFLSMVF